MMNRKVRDQLRAVEMDKKLNWEVIIKRPFVTVTIRDKKHKIYGAGHACVQLPDVWSEEQGINMAKI